MRAASAARLLDRRLAGRLSRSAGPGSDGRVRAVHLRSRQPAPPPRRHRGPAAAAGPRGAGPAARAARRGGHQAGADLGRLARRLRHRDLDCRGHQRAAPDAWATTRSGRSTSRRCTAAATASSPRSSTPTDRRGAPRPEARRPGPPPTSPSSPAPRPRPSRGWRCWCPGSSRCSRCWSPPRPGGATSTRPPRSRLRRCDSRSALPPGLTVSASRRAARRLERRVDDRLRRLRRRAVRDLPAPVVAGRRHAGGRHRRRHGAVLLGRRPVARVLRRRTPAGDRARRRSAGDPGPGGGAVGRRLARRRPDRLRPVGRRRAVRRRADRQRPAAADHAGGRRGRAPLAGGSARRVGRRLQRVGGSRARRRVLRGAGVDAHRQLGSRPRRRGRRSRADRRSPDRATRRRPGRQLARRAHPHAGRPAGRRRVAAAARRRCRTTPSTTPARWSQSPPAARPCTSCCTGPATYAVWCRHRSRRCRADVRGADTARERTSDMEARVEQWRADTPGCAARIHLNNAGAALMPRPVLRGAAGAPRARGRAGRL